MNKLNNIEELLQTYFNESDHYLAPAKLKHTDTGINGDGVVYSVRVSNECDARGFETVGIEQNELLLWIYNHEKI